MHIMPFLKPIRLKAGTTPYLAYGHGVVNIYGTPK